MKFTDHEATLVEEVLQHDGFELLMRRSDEKRAAIVDALTSKTTGWDDTNRYRGQLQALDLFTAKAIRSDYPPKSEKP